MIFIDTKKGEYKLTELNLNVMRMWIWSLNSLCIMHISNMILRQKLENRRIAIAIKFVELKILVSRMTSAHLTFGWILLFVNNRKYNILTLLLIIRFYHQTWNPSEWMQSKSRIIIKTRMMSDKWIIITFYTVFAVCGSKITSIAVLKLIRLISIISETWICSLDS